MAKRDVDIVVLSDMHLGTYAATPKNCYNILKVSNHRPLF
jgi:hypothetical protein